MPPTNKMSPTNTFMETLQLYLTNIIKDTPTEELELEVKFGTRNVQPISQINYDNVIKKLLAAGFTQDSNTYLLRIQSEFRDIKTGVTKLSYVRTEINGLQNIRTYCKTNNITDIDIKTGLLFLQKKRFNETLAPANMDDFNCRATLSKEETLKKETPVVRAIIDKWKDNKKTFRYLFRTKLRHPTLPFIIDLSIVKDSKRQGKFYVPEYNIHDAGVFNAPASYEIEIECINKQVGIGTAYNTADLLHKALKTAIKQVLSGLQETNYPIGFSEQSIVIQNYMRLLWGKEYNPNGRITAANFVGPSSYTLELKHIRPKPVGSLLPNIRENYTVTDKADGERKLLFIDTTGKIYLINTNMEVQFTGTLAKNPDTWNSLLDGEHILNDKRKKFINLYAAFDIYYINGVDVRAKAFVPPNTDSEEDVKDTNNYRLSLLEQVVPKMNPISVVNPEAPPPLKITKKRFYLGSDTKTIFQGCAFILKKEYDGLFEYNTDGLIFTPANLGVGARPSALGTGTAGTGAAGTAGTGAAGTGTSMLKPIKATWEYSFKWKPPKFNTIDFLVSVKKEDNGNDFVGSIFSDGMDVSSASQLNEYKTLILRVGFDESKHGFINPYQDVIDDKLPDVENYDNADKYVPVQFFPTDPSDYKAGICNISMRDDFSGEKKMFTEEGEVIEDNMIVEFSYDMTREEQWRWSPLRVRYDKTAQFRAGEKNFGNAFHVANNNWHSIHNPITQQMIMSGENLPTEVDDTDVYYNKASSISKTKALRDFHNLYVKKMLIQSVAKPGDTLIDLAVGKGGDWPKWIDAKLKFVFGVDISRDNIQNRMDGAYARYLNYRKRNTQIPAALFVNGNSSVNIKNTNGILVDKDKQITRAVFGQGAKDAKILGQGVYKNYGIAAEGFNVCSIQFAIHYMFENQETLQNFLQNVSEVTKEGGYFIGTSFDGERLFDMLKDLPENESKVIFSDVGDEKKKIWEVTKRYDRAEFNSDETCVGYAVDIFQETINKTFREYLVNYTYLTRVLENYGFVLLEADELAKLRSPLTHSTGLFNELFNKMNDELRQNPRMRSSYNEAPNMSAGERTISFLNRYFIYKKVRKVSDADKISLNLQHKTAVEERTEDLETAAAQQTVKQTLLAMATPTAQKTLTIKRKPKTAIAKEAVSEPAELVPSQAVPAQAALPAPSALALGPAAPVPKTLTIKKKPKLVFAKETPFEPVPIETVPIETGPALGPLPSGLGPVPSGLGPVPSGLGPASLGPTVLKLKKKRVLKTT